jgi:hypothetical protein
MKVAPPSSPLGTPSPSSAHKSRCSDFLAPNENMPPSASIRVHLQHLRLKIRIFHDMENVFVTFCVFCSQEGFQSVIQAGKLAAPPLITPHHIHKPLFMDSLN